MTKKKGPETAWVAVRWGVEGKGDELLGVWNTEQALRDAHPEAYRRFDVLGNRIPRVQDTRTAGVDYWREEIRSGSE